MITIFNRRQLAVTYALEEKIHICRVLAEQNIAYLVREIHRTAPHAITSERPRDGSFGKQSEMVTAYFIYVKKSDFTAAVKALGAKTAEKLSAARQKKKSSQLGGLFARGIYCIFFWHSGQTPSSTRFI